MHRPSSEVSHIFALNFKHNYIKTSVSGKQFSMYRYAYKDVKKITKMQRKLKLSHFVKNSAEGMHDLLSKQELLGLVSIQERVIAMPVMQFLSFPISVI